MELVGVWVRGLGRLEIEDLSGAHLVVLLEKANRQAQRSRHGILIWTDIWIEVVYVDGGRLCVNLVSLGRGRFSSLAGLLRPVLFSTL